jgi:hypothetical protein
MIVPTGIRAIGKAEDGYLNSFCAKNTTNCAVEHYQPKGCQIDRYRRVEEKT